jgi:hypothetical protein
VVSTSYQDHPATHGGRSRQNPGTSLENPTGTLARPYHTTLCLPAQGAGGPTRGAHRAGGARGQPDGWHVRRAAPARRFPRAQSRGAWRLLPPGPQWCSQGKPPAAVRSAPACCLQCTCPSTCQGLGSSRRLGQCWRAQVLQAHRPAVLLC